MKSITGPVYYHYAALSRMYERLAITLRHIRGQTKLEDPLNGKMGFQVAPLLDGIFCHVFV